MSIASEVSRISQNVQNTISVIQQTGVSVPENPTSDNLPSLAEALANEKQNKLTGTQGQVVGFDSSGNAIAQEAPSGGAPNVQFVTLSGTGWGSSQNVASVPGMTATSKVIVGLAEPNTSEQYDAAVKAQLHCITKADGLITIAANGTTPSIDIPIVVYFWGGTA